DNKEQQALQIIQGKVRLRHRPCQKPNPAALSSLIWKRGTVDKSLGTESKLTHLMGSFYLPNIF
ncbi:Hypothetical protein SMAX5B_022470, partial [Scophthalmus maximus]